MKPLRLDFSRSPKAVPWLGLVLVLAGVLALIAVMRLQDNADLRRDLLDDRTDRVSERTKALDLTQKASAESEPLSEKVAVVELEQEREPTIGLQILEKTWTPDVAYLKVDISTRDRTVKLVLETRTHTALLTLVDAFSNNPSVQRVSLVREELKVAEPTRPVHAEVELWWRESQ